MLLVYRQQLGLATGTLEAMFGFYALGLIPGLLIAGPLSDARGRRPVVLASAVLSLAGTLSLVVAGDTLALLFAGRFLIGLGSGAAFGAGTAWLRELSRPPFGDVTDHSAARRGAVAMTVGFAAGPLVSGVLAQWAPDPGVVPYLPHVVLMLAVLALVPAAPETGRASGRGGGAIARALPSLRHPRFRRVVAPMAPWVFAAPAVASRCCQRGRRRPRRRRDRPDRGRGHGRRDGRVLVQPVARHLDANGTGSRAATLGLSVIVVGRRLQRVHRPRASSLAARAQRHRARNGVRAVPGGRPGRGAALAHPEALAGLTAIYYVPHLPGLRRAVRAHAGRRPGQLHDLLLITAGLALLTAVWVRLQDRPAR